jgi:hypothetical protein
VIFPDYWTICVVGGCLLFGSIGIYMFRRTRSSRYMIKVPTQFLSALTVVASGLLLCMFGCASAFNVTTHSIPIYSPDHSRALRITDVDSGALGGYTFITLYSYHGLVGRTIFAGDWRATEPRAVQWITNSQVAVRYDASYIHPPRCNWASGVSISCEPVKYAYPH